MTASAAPARDDPRPMPASATASIALHDPSTGDHLADVAVDDGAAVRDAVTRAASAAPGWRRTAPAERAALLKASARRLRDRVEKLARLQTSEMGKPIGDSRGGVEAGIAAMEQYAELGPLHRGRSLQGEWGATDLMVPGPYGVAACIVPWNDPVAVALGLVSACVVTGNVVVLKPSERAPLAVTAAAGLLDLPDGIVTVVNGGPATGAALVADDRVSLVCHVGSVPTGRAIAAACAARLKKVVLELGGNDPLIVDGDVDPVWAADQAAIGAFANAGQICTSVERIYVHEAVADAFTRRLVARAESLVTGDGRDPATQLGPLVDDRLRRSVHAQVSAAVADGATLACGGRIPDGPGTFYPATVLTGCSEGMAVMDEETFGPVAPIAVVRSFDEALAGAASGEHGLAATVLTASAAHAQRAWRELDVGTVKVNAVFGGAPGGAAHPHGQSGTGFGYGPELLDEVTRTRVVHLRPAPR